MQPGIFVYRPPLTRTRVRVAFATAIAVDVLQFILGPFGVAFADEVLDVVAMTVIWRALGFHVLLLPTFVLEFVPLVDFAPTWTVCVYAVVALRRRQEPPPPGPGEVIDV